MPGLPTVQDHIFYIFMYVIQHCFVCRPSDSIASEDAGINVFWFYSRDKAIVRQY
jgi:hypothetical protein